MRALVLLLLSLMCIACGDGSEGVRVVASTCDLNSDCADPLVCRRDRCRVQCRTNTDCGAGLECEQDPTTPGLGTCYLPDENECENNGQCTDGLVCVYNGQRRVCTAMCSTSEDCQLGETCDMTSGAGVCQGTPLECTTSADCREGLTCFYDGRCHATCTVGQPSTCPPYFQCVAPGYCEPSDLVGDFDAGRGIDAGVIADAAFNMDAPSVVLLDGAPLMSDLSYPSSDAVFSGDASTSIPATPLMMVSSSDVIGTNLKNTFVTSIHDVDGQMWRVAGASLSFGGDEASQGLRAMPVSSMPVISTTYTPTDLAMGQTHSCGLFKKESGEFFVDCWGDPRKWRSTLDESWEVSPSSLSPSGTTAREVEISQDGNTTCVLNMHVIGDPTINCMHVLTSAPSSWQIDLPGAAADTLTLLRINADGGSGCIYDTASAQFKCWGTVANETFTAPRSSATAAPTSLGMSGLTSTTSALDLVVHDKVACLVAPVSGGSGLQCSMRDGLSGWTRIEAMTEPAMGSAVREIEIAFVDGDQIALWAITSDASDRGLQWRVTTSPSLSISFVSNPIATDPDGIGPLSAASPMYWPDGVGAVKYARALTSAYSSAADFHACALLSTSGLSDDWRPVCWGVNNLGQLGNGAPSHPGDVVRPTWMVRR